ncbi:hypothetical protein VTK56DRAFT_9760 [Thermocarpiscus australiensis]
MWHPPLATLGGVYRWSETAKSLPWFHTRCTPSSSAIYATSFSLWTRSEMTRIGFSASPSGKSYLVSVRFPRRIFIRQWALPWSWIGLPLPGDQTRTSCVRQSGDGCKQKPSRPFPTTYQVALSIAFINEISCVPPTCVSHGEPGPFLRVRLIVTHQPVEILDVDVV